MTENSIHSDAGLGWSDACVSMSCDVFPLLCAPLQLLLNAQQQDIHAYVFSQSLRYAL